MPRRPVRHLNASAATFQGSRERRLYATSKEAEPRRPTDEVDFCGRLAPASAMTRSSSVNDDLSRACPGSQAAYSSAVGLFCHNRSQGGVENDRRRTRPAPW